MWTRALEWGAGGLAFFFSSACAFHWLQPVNLLHLSLLRTKTNPSPASSFPFSCYLIFTLCHLEILNKVCASVVSTAWDHRTFFPLLQTSSPWLMRNHILHNHSFPLSCVGNSLPVPWILVFLIASSPVLPRAHSFLRSQLPLINEWFFTFISSPRPLSNTS